MTDPAEIATRHARLIELADSCEKATGPDRLFDREMARALNVMPLHQRRGSLNMTWPDYTTSIDAALTLVRDDCLHLVRTVWDGNERAGFASVSRYTTDEHCRKFWAGEHQATATTPTLALCAAALRALASEEKP